MRRLPFVLVLLARAAAIVHVVNGPDDVAAPEAAYLDAHWGSVKFPPVPQFSIDTHDPITQDVYISSTVHTGIAPWDPYIWDRIVALSKGVRTETQHFVDVGANLGYFSLAAASLGYRVIAFEPMSRNVYKMARSVARNHGFANRTVLYQNAVSDITGQRVALRETDASNQGNGQLLAARPPATGGVYGVDYVDSVTLSGVLLFSPVQRIDAHIVKIDVEGFEAAVLLGAREWLCSRTVRHVILEFSDATRTSASFPATELFRFMQRAGYTVSDVNIAADAFMEYAPLVAGNFDGVPPNLLFSLAFSDMQRSC